MILIPAFTVTELTKAFEIGFLLYLPFIAIDLIVSNILLAMGMMMVSPLTISLPVQAVPVRRRRRLDAPDPRSRAELRVSGAAERRRCDERSHDRPSCRHRRRAGAAAVDAAIIVATVVGVLVSLIQALTQIQEQTLGFAVKLVAVVVTMVATAPWLGAQMREYTLRIFEQFPMLTR